MKVIQVNVLCDSGSTGKIVRDIDTVLTARGIESWICYGRKNTFNTNRTYKFCTEAEAYMHKILNKCGFSLMYGGNHIATHRLINYINRENPDVVHLHCINGDCVNIYRLLEFLANSGVKTVVTHHAEFYYTGNCGYCHSCRKFSQNSRCRGCELPKSRPENSGFRFPHRSWERMNKAFHSFKPGTLLFTAVSPWVKAQSEMSPIVKGYPCTVVINGIDTSVFYRRDDVADIKARIPNLRKRIIFHATASFTDRPNLKGGNYIVELARRMPDYTFVIAASHSAVISELPSNIYLWGRTKDQNELAQLYSAADLTVIASSAETFSMIVAESLCCGTPIVGFKAGGPETIAIPGYSRFVDYGNLELLQNEIEIMAHCSNIDRNLISTEAKAMYNKEKMAENYISVYNSL